MTSLTLGAADEHDEHTGERVAHRAVMATTAVTLYLLFTWVQERLGHDVASAHAHARLVQSVERSLHLDAEAPLNAWVAGHTVVEGVLAVAYPAVLPLVPVALVALAVLRPARYWRRLAALAVVSGLALPAFGLFPVAPPRLGQPGIVDVVARRTAMAGSMTPGSGGHANLYAATPSLHVAWSAWCAAALRDVVPRARRVARRALLALPLLVAVDVVATGNHYVVDTVAGAALALLGLAVTRPRTVRPGAPAAGSGPGTPARRRPAPRARASRPATPTAPVAAGQAPGHLRGT